MDTPDSAPAPVENVIQRRPNGTILPGTRLNPRGNQGESYRRIVERQFEKQLLARMDAGEDSARTVSEAILDKVLTSAARGKPWAIKLILDRMLPAVERHEHGLGDAEAASVDALMARLAGLAAARRTRVGGGGADGAGANGSGRGSA